MREEKVEGLMPAVDWRCALLQSLSLSLSLSADADADAASCVGVCVSRDIPQSCRVSVSMRGERENRGEQSVSLSLISLHSLPALDADTTAAAAASVKLFEERERE